MKVNSISVRSCNDQLSNRRNTETTAVNTKNILSVSTISIIRVKDESSTRETSRNEVSKDDENALRSIYKIAIITLGTVTLSSLSVVPWTMIPRTNSIIFQSSWMELMLPFACISILHAATDMLNLTIWTKEPSIISMKVLLKMTFMNNAPFSVLYIFSHITWCTYLGYNHPMPYLGLIQIGGWLIYMMSLHSLVPSSLIANEAFRKRIRMYIIYYIWSMVLALQNEVLSYVFANLPEAFQFLVAFMIAACREFDKKVKTQLVATMMGTIDEPGSVLLAITTGAFFSSFIANRIAGTTVATVFCIVSIVSVSFVFL